MQSSSEHHLPGSLLQLKVGFLMHGSVGMSRNFPFELPSITIGEDLTVAAIHGSLQLSRTSEGLWLQGALQVPYPGECSRCLVEMTRVAAIQLEELIGLPGILPRSGPTEFAVHDDGILDLGPILRAELLIESQKTALCREDCAGLCSECGQILNEARCSCEAPIDPRWIALAAHPNKRTSQGGDNE